MSKFVNESLDEFLFEKKKAKTKGDKKFSAVMHHWKEGSQHIGKSKKTVPVTKKGQKQAIAIAFSEKEKIDKK